MNVQSRLARLEERQPPAPVRVLFDTGLSVERTEELDREADELARAVFEVVRFRWAGPSSELPTDRRRVSSVRGTEGS